MVYGSDRHHRAAFEHDGDGHGSGGRRATRKEQRQTPDERGGRAGGTRRLNSNGPRQHVHDREEALIDDVVVRDVRSGGEHEACGDCRAVGPVVHRASQRQRERRQDPRRHQIEMTEQMHREVRRQAEDHGREHRGTPLPTAFGAEPAGGVVAGGFSGFCLDRGRQDRPDQRVHGGHVREHVGHQQQVLRGDDRERLQRRRRDERRQRGVRMVRDRRPERVEEVAGVKVLEPRRREHVAHPPQVPEKAVVVAGIARDRVTEVQDERPRPADGQSRKEHHRAGVLTNACTGERDIPTHARGEPVEPRALVAARPSTSSGRAVWRSMRAHRIIAVA